MLSPQSHGSGSAAGYHTPVLAGEVVGLLRDKHRILDGTLGGGAHTRALLEQGATVTALDRDPEAIAEASARLREFVQSGKFFPILGNFSDIDEIEATRHARFDGILLDLGVSSHQLDELERGFSFREGAPLDMRMGNDASFDAAELLASADERELARIFREYGDEPRSHRLAREIVRRRANRPFRTSDDLVGAIRGVLGPRSGAADFARLFQAVRIAVNRELEGLAAALPALRDHLEGKGVMVVISYHSGEDRIVKRAFREWSTACTCPPLQPVCTCGGRALGETLTRKAVIASAREIELNSRARSARLRAWRAE
ncbi:MAG TPA: 16S rRNA (cytosine(1402)-N(4))-methyltransferase RsmH [Gemmatimonadaceae bacterium]|nr:16S rRNA (cytosine(1402)-N(4))-methyltransferase RsmH [Gemmatimonadaceae bacterium]